MKTLKHMYLQIPNPKFDFSFIVFICVVVQRCHGCGASAMFPSSWVRHRRGWVIGVIVSLHSGGA